MSVPDNWYESFFHGVTLDLWRRAIPPEQTAAEAEFLMKQLQCAEGARVLDVPCGNGRLSFELAKRGLRVTGVDISDEFIAEARSQSEPPALADGPDAAPAGHRDHGPGFERRQSATSGNSSFGCMSGVSI